MTQNDECWILPNSVSLTVCDAGRKAVLDQMLALLGSVDIGDDVSMPHAQSQGGEPLLRFPCRYGQKRIYLLTAWPSVSYKELKTIAAFIELFKDERKKKELLLVESSQELFEKIKVHLSGYGIIA